MIRSKRAFDITASIAGILLLAPVFVFVSLAILLDDGRPVFFRQRRVGLHERIFWMWKFRTMRTASVAGPLLTVAGDDRITRAGGFLRRTKIDELPQLLNVLVGEMSLVGPRPEVERYVREYRTRERRVFEIKPGITDPASLRYRNESDVLATVNDPEQFYVRSIMRKKLRINMAYSRRATLCSDLAVVIRTVVPPVTFKKAR